MTNTTTKPTVKVIVPLEIPLERIENLLISATEGGIGYWGRIMGYEIPNGKTLDDYEYPHFQVVLDGGKMFLHDTEEEDSHYKTLSAEEKEKWTLTYDKLIKGLQVMANLKPGEGGHHFPNFLAENDDAETSDVFVQCCLFGEIVYG